MNRNEEYGPTKAYVLAKVKPTQRRNVLLQLIQFIRAVYTSAKRLQKIEQLPRTIILLITNRICRRFALTLCTQKVFNYNASFYSTLSWHFSIQLSCWHRYYETFSKHTHYVQRLTESRVKIPVSTHFVSGSGFIEYLTINIYVVMLLFDKYYLISGL